MKYFIYLFTIIVLLGLNLGLFVNLRIGGQIPNLLFLLVLFFALENKDLDFFFISLVSGLFLDFYSTGFFGEFTLAFLIVGFCAQLFVSNILVFELNWKTLCLSLLIALAFFNFVVWLGNGLAFKLGWDNQYVTLRVFLLNFPASLFYNLLLLYPMYWLANFLRRLIDNLSLKRRGIIR